MTHRPAQATVEFALAVPLFLLVVLALADFSRLLFTYVSLTNGAREMARVASVATSQDSAAVAAFNAYTIISGVTNPATDHVVVTVADESCVNDQRQGNSCATGTLSSATCNLPLQARCTLPPRRSAGGGYVQVDVTYTFTFLTLTSMPGVSVLTTSARSYVE